MNRSDQIAFGRRFAKSTYCSHSGGRALQTIVTKLHLVVELQNRPTALYSGGRALRTVVTKLHLVVDLQNRPTALHPGGRRL